MGIRGSTPCLPDWLGHGDGLANLPNDSYLRLFRACDIPLTASSTLIPKASVI